MTTSYTRDQVPQPKGGVVSKPPSEGTIIEDPDASPVYVLKYLINLILDSAQGLPAQECALLVKAMACAHFHEIGTPCLTFDDRSDEVYRLIGKLVVLYNNTNIARVDVAKLWIVAGDHPKSTTLQFIAKKVAKIE